MPLLSAGLLPGSFVSVALGPRFSEFGWLPLGVKIPVQGGPGLLGVLPALAVGPVAVLIIIPVYALMPVLITLATPLACAAVAVAPTESVVARDSRGAHQTVA